MIWYRVMRLPILLQRTLTIMIRMLQVLFYPKSQQHIHCVGVLQKTNSYQLIYLMNNAPCIEIGRAPV